MALQASSMFVAILIQCFRDEIFISEKNEKVV